MNWDLGLQGLLYLGAMSIGSAFSLNCSQDGLPRNGCGRSSQPSTSESAFS